MKILKVLSPITILILIVSMGEIQAAQSSAMFNAVITNHHDAGPIVNVHRRHYGYAPRYYYRGEYGYRNYRPYYYRPYYYRPYYYGYPRHGYIGPNYGYYGYPYYGRWYRPGVHLHFGW